MSLADLLQKKEYLELANHKTTPGILHRRLVEMGLDERQQRIISYYVAVLLEEARTQAWRELHEKQKDVDKKFLRRWGIVPTF